MVEKVADMEKNEGSEVDESLVVQLRKPVTFEGKEYAEVDLRGLNNLTAMDMIREQTRLRRAGMNPPTVETDISFCLGIAAAAATLPLEFFEALPARDAVAVKNTVSFFLLGVG